MRKVFMLRQTVALVNKQLFRLRQNIFVADYIAQLFDERFFSLKLLLTGCHG